MLELKCVKCGKKYGASASTCIHNKYYDYLECLSGTIKNPSVSLGQGNTPLIKLKKLGKILGIYGLHAKDEGRNPTGSFKDRESFMLVNKALELGIKEVFCVSSGNAAISLSAYSNLVGIKCTCFVPKNTSKEKKDLIKIFKGELKEINGSYEEIYRKKIDHPPIGLNCTLNPYKSEGTKEIAYEIFREIGAPDKVIVPCGNGSNIFGIWKGFREIGANPKMIGVQIENSAPLKTALESGKDFETVKGTSGSIAEGILATESYSSPKALKAIKGSRGWIVTVSENEIKNSLKEALDLESIVMEPTSASAFAALKKIETKKREKIIVVITGSGLKNLQTLSKICKD